MRFKRGDAVWLELMVEGDASQYLLATVVRSQPLPEGGMGYLLSDTTEEDIASGEAFLAAEEDLMTEPPFQANYKFRPGDVVYVIAAPDGVVPRVEPTQVMAVIFFPEREGFVPGYLTALTRNEGPCEAGVFATEAEALQAL